MPVGPLPGANALNAGWVCFGLGLLFVFVPIPFTCIVYGPLFLISIIMAIVGLSNGRTGPGLALLLCSLILPPAAVAAAWALGAAAVAGALKSMSAP